MQTGYTLKYSPAENIFKLNKLRRQLMQKYSNKNKFSHQQQFSSDLLDTLAASRTYLLSKIMKFVYLIPIPVKKKLETRQNHQTAIA